MHPEDGQQNKVPVFPDETLDDLQRGGYRMLQKKSCFRLGTDSVLLAAYGASFYGNNPAKRILAADLGAGAGAVSLLAAARLPGIRLVALEMDDDSFSLLERNCRLNGLGERLQAVHGDIRDLAAGKDAGESLKPGVFDLVITNPPYWRARAGLTTADAAKSETTLGLPDLLKAARRLLKPGGRLVMIHHISRLPEIMTLLTANDLEPKTLRFVQSLPKKAPSVFLLSAICQGRPGGLVAEPPLIIEEKAGVFSREVAQIYGIDEPTDDTALRGGTNTAGKGTLYLVGTPIGNLGDLAPRAAATLESCDFVAAEDTRRTLRLLNHLGLRKHLESYHEHNRMTRDAHFLDILRGGRSIALVSDAGMPAISDPGSELAAACLEEGIPVVVVPGPCAAIVGLVGSGLETGRFTFEGFLPAAGKLRKQRILELANERRTIVLYEAPHRLCRTLGELTAVMAERRLSIARELTKIHEETIRTTVGEAVGLTADNPPRGEFVLILEGLDAYKRRMSPDAGGPASQPPGASSGTEVPGDQAVAQARQLLEELLGQGLSVKDAVKQCASPAGLKKNQLYKIALDCLQNGAGLRKA